MSHKICQIPPLQVIAIEGTHAASFLQGQITCDVSLLRTSSGSWGGCCDRKGRVIATFFIWGELENFYLLLPTSLAAMLLNHFKKYVLASKVSLHLDQRAILEVKTLPPYLTLPFEVPVLTSPRHSFFVIAPTEVMSTIYMALPPDSCVPDVNAWRLWNIESGLVWVYPETKELFLPQMLGLNHFNAISFTKGCYVGQEIVARTQHLGALKRHLYHGRVLTSQMINAGNPILDATHSEVGILTEVARCEKGFMFLAVLSDSALHSPLSVQGDPIQKVNKVWKN